MEDKSDTSLSKVLSIIFAVICCILIICAIVHVVNFIIKGRIVKDAIVDTIDNDLYCNNFPGRCKITFNNNLPVPTIYRYNKQTALFCIDAISRMIQFYLNKSESYVGIPIHPQLRLVQQFKVSNDELSTIGYMATDNYNNLWIVFRGTLDQTELLNDFVSKQITPQSTEFIGITTHKGFTDVFVSFYKAFTPAMASYNAIIITGHSLGAALALLSTYYIVTKYLGGNSNNVYLYTFASPRVCDIKSSYIIDNVIKNNYRIVNISDIIPTIPLPVMPDYDNPPNPFMYRHTGRLISFDQNWESVKNNHMIYNYKYYLQNSN